MKQIELNKDIEIEIEGLGLVLHSGEMNKNIPEGYDFLKNNFWNPSDVAAQVNSGKLVGFCTGSPGTYILKFRSGVPDAEINEKYNVGKMLWIKIDNNKLYIRDLYDLLEWHKQIDEKYILDIKNGNYFMFLNTRMPDSNIIGDNQEIYIHLLPTGYKPSIEVSGVPQLVCS